MKEVNEPMGQISKWVYLRDRLATMDRLIAELRVEVAELKAKRGPGRPPKDKAEAA